MSRAPGAESIIESVTVVIIPLIVLCADAPNVKEPLISVAPSNCAVPSTSIALWNCTLPRKCLPTAAPPSPLSCAARIETFLSRSAIRLGLILCQ